LQLVQEGHMLVLPAKYNVNIHLSTTTTAFAKLNAITMRAPHAV